MLEMRRAVTHGDRVGHAEPLELGRLEGDDVDRVRATARGAASRSTARRPMNSTVAWPWLYWRAREQRLEQASGIGAPVS